MKLSLVAGRVTFLLGAGASVDAGLPAVAKLTQKLRNLLPSIPENAGYTGHQLCHLYDQIAKADANVESNYERLFEWLELVIKAGKDPYQKLIGLSVDAGAAWSLAWVVNYLVCRVFQDNGQAMYEAGYFSEFERFLPAHGRLPVYTLNYDLCVEYDCRSKAIEVCTGFHPSSGKWTPSLFRGKKIGINLYKLHGSLNWYDKNNTLDYSEIVEKYPLTWEPGPQLILGPGSKLQPDDPFVTLFHNFHETLGRARVCVIIGYSYADNHINKVLHWADRRGVRIIDVNPAPASEMFENYCHIKDKARHALKGNDLLELVNQNAGSE